MVKNTLTACICISILSLIAFSSCKKEDDVQPGAKGSIVLEFDNLANGSTFTLGKDYTNANGDVMNFSIFDYYVSNFSLVKDDGSIYVVPKDSCYFLIREKGGLNTEIEIANIPAGDYKELRFMLGIDSLKSVAPVAERTGVLDPAGEGADMYWAWNSGYIFVKAEGVSPQAPLDAASNTNKFRYHIGLFGGYSSPTLNNIKTFALQDEHGEVAEVRSNKKPHYHLKVDVMEMFKKPETVSVAANHTVMVSPYSKVIADNYADMITLGHIHN